MIRKRNSICILILLVSLSSKAQTEMSYEYFISNIKENNPLVARARNIKEKGNQLYQSAKGGYDPLISAEYDNKNFDDKNYYSSLITKVKQPLFTSQYITTGYEYGQGYYLNPDLKTSTYGLPYIGIEASLLQGLVIDKRRAEVLKSKNYKGYYEAEQNAQINDILYIASLSYFDWVYSCKELSLQKYFLTLAEQRYMGIRALADIGERAIIDTIEANMVMKSRSLDLQSSTIENQKRVASLLSLRWTSPSEPSKSGDRISLRDSLEHYFDVVKNDYVRTIQNVSISNPLLKKYEHTQEILKVEKRYKAELIKPKLDVKYNFLFNTLADKGPALNASNYRWSANLSFPLLLRTARHDYQIAKLELANNQIELDNKKNELSFKISLTRQNINLLLEQVSNAETNVEYSKQLLTAEKLKFERGESSLFLLNTRESKFLESELKLAEYKLKFIKNYIELVYLRGDLDYNI
jgi:outer membrane protein TolC